MRRSYAAFTSTSPYHTPIFLMERVSSPSKSPTTSERPRDKPPDDGRASPEARRAFAKHLVQRAAPGPEIRWYVRARTNLLEQVSLRELRATVSAVHQPSWTVSKAEIPMMNKTTLLEALNQYLRNHLAYDQDWNMENDDLMEEDPTPAAQESPKPACTEAPPGQSSSPPHYSFGNWAASIQFGFQQARAAL